MSVTERAFSFQATPLANAFHAVSVIARCEHRGSAGFKVFEADWTRLPSNRRPNYLFYHLLAVRSRRRRRFHAFTERE